MNADLSVAPEIAQLAAPLALIPAPLGHPAPAAATTGQLAAALSRLAAAPQRWWDLVRFDPDRPARIPVPAPFEAWLLVIPPGQDFKCDCQLATLVAGEASEGTQALRPGRVRVNGTLLAGGAHGASSRDAHHLVRAVGQGYSVSLHAGA